MQTVPLSFSRTTQKAFDELVEAVQRVALEKSFRTLHVHDVQATLKEKGFDIGSYKIVEVCNAGYAHRVIGAFPDIGMFLPCRIAVYERGGECVLTMMNPGVMPDMFPGVDMGDVPAVVQEALQAVIEEAAS